MTSMLEDFLQEYRRYRALGERALAQMPDSALNRVSSPEGNSAAMVVRHVSGNFASRFTDFLTTDGEKPWRERDEEFTEQEYTRADVNRLWAAGFQVLEHALAGMTDADLVRIVTIRAQPMTVHAALCRSLAHVSYHVGQIVLLAREGADAPWQSLSIPRGQSAAYNASPTNERGSR